MPTSAILVGDHGAVLRVDPKAPLDAAAIERAFDPLRSALPRVLVERPTPALRRAVSFFTARVPDVARGLAPFLSELTAPGPSGRTPVVEGLYLDGRDADDAVGDPFAVDAGSADAALAARRRKLLIAGAAIAGACVLVSAVATIALYVHHRNQVDAATTAVDALVKDTQAASSGDRVATRKVEDDERAAGDRVRAFVHAEASLWLYRGTFAADKARARSRFLDAVRSYYLLPKTRETGSRRKTLHAVALVYAASSNEIGHDMVLADPARWATIVGVPEAVARDQAELAATTWDGKVTIPTQPPSTAPEAQSLDAWGRYLDELQRVFAAVAPGSTAAALTQADLDALKDENARFYAVLDETADDDEARRVAAALERVAPVDAKDVESLLVQSDVPGWVNDNRPALTGLLGLVKDASIDVTPPARWSLTDLFAALGAAPSSSIPDATYAFKLKQRWFSFTTKDWAEVLRRGRSRVLLDAFLASHRRDPSDPALVPVLRRPARVPGRRRRRRARQGPVGVAARHLHEGRVQARGRPRVRCVHGADRQGLALRPGSRAARGLRRAGGRPLRRRVPRRPLDLLRELPAQRLLGRGAPLDDRRADDAVVVALRLPRDGRREREPGAQGRRPLPACGAAPRGVPGHRRADDTAERAVPQPREVRLVPESAHHAGAGGRRQGARARRPALAHGPLGAVDAARGQGLGLPPGGIRG